MNKDNFHGIIFKRSQRDQSVFNDLNIIGRRNVIPGIIVLFKVEVPSSALELLIQKLQANMAKRFLYLIHEFSFHFYRGNELINVFRNKVFRVTTDRSSWIDVVEHGKIPGIPAKQLDFIPYKVEDEKYDLES
jgi:hypothetical protein